MIELLKGIDANITFKATIGPLRSRLSSAAMAVSRVKFVNLFSANSYDIQVSISSHTVEEDVFRFLVPEDPDEQVLEFKVSELGADELADLKAQLSQQLALQPPAPVQVPGKTIIRKHVTGMLDIQQAAQQLGCTQTFLKSKVPCTDYSYIEVEGKKEIKDYYWSNQLIERLGSIKAKSVTAEDVTFIAEECCFGDSKWAEEMLTAVCGPVPSARSDKPQQHNQQRRPQNAAPKDRPGSQGQGQGQGQQGAPRRRRR